MIKKILFMAALTALLLPLHADNYVTRGDGTTYTWASLAQESGGIVSYNASTQVCILDDSLTIADGDRLVSSSDLRRLLITRPGAKLVVHGELVFDGETISDIRYSDMTGTDEDGSADIIFDNGARENTLVNINFRKVGLRADGASSLRVDGCTMSQYNGSNAAAIYMVNSTGQLTVVDTSISDCNKAAIGNSYGCQNVVLVEDCELLGNALNNANTPQINLVASADITIRGCVITGDDNLTMVGGIGVANWTAAADTHVLLDNNVVTGCRYGVTTFGPSNVTICNNQLKDNNRETNANNGGSGISIYDPYYLTSARIYGNKIEGNLWGITIIGGGDVNLGHTTDSQGNPLAEDAPEYCVGNNEFLNNGNNGESYDLYNNGTATVYAQNNLWSVFRQTPDEIETVIFHKYDDSSLGEVIYRADGTSSIAALTTPAPNGILSAIGIYDLQGRKVADRTLLPRGIYIVKENGKTIKKTW